MPFSSLSDPADLARAYAVVDAVWDEVKERVAEADRERERTRLAYIVAGLVPMALDEEELKQSVRLHYRQAAST